ncbi:LacI family transcriptional regulator [Paenibacillus forsythiae]|uniref:LacI family transcriptional regulator n=2 Tax=Paenibacillus forsythiae TaxID=365616 RepID=A0ABU3H8N2_9BACL|nr:LacI family DNA-binding transcriptional regulator [Paenibacillus forsythiae]MDT3427085.1 LacI family transcriptional regulator [Paenibacillus forsythiae]
MAERVTIQHIADALGLSRNTVSKALNNHPQIPDATREKIVQKAAELKYKNFSSMNMGNIALLTRGDINAISFYSETIKGMETGLSAQGLNLILMLVKPDDIHSNALPPNINPLNIDGIVCMEIFRQSYVETILGAGIPTVFIDFLPGTVFDGHKYDIIMVENEYSAYTLTKSLIDEGHENIGFIGDLRHCRSFYERWLGFERAMRDFGRGPDPAFSITPDDTQPYLSVEWMTSRLKGLAKLPTAFICANDDIGICAIRALKELKIQVPEQIEITGFDDVPNANIIDPPLTTVHTYPYELGTRVVETLLNRIEQPDRHKETIYLESSIILRGSTRQTAGAASGIPSSQA